MAVVVCALGCSVFVGACSSEEAAPAAARTAPAEAPAADPATTGTVTGTIAGAMPGAIVTLAPESGAPVEAQAAPPIMDQIQLSFVPGTLLARTGFPVEFHSSDSELHNINVRNPDKREGEFNRSIPPGGTFEHVFKESGFYDVRCDIHPAMTAEIFVSDAPYAAVLGGDGSFLFQGIPPGAYTMKIYSGAFSSEQSVEIKIGDNQITADAPSS